MLESSGLSHNEQLMVLTSTSNDRDFDTVAAALLEQHSKAHMSESRKTHDQKKSKGYGKGYQRHGNYASNAYEE
eukprot:611301-Karenia_brevis.AAC.1